MLTNLFKLVLQLSILGSVAAVTIILIKIVCKNKFSARWNYWLWIILFIRLAIPISFSSNLSVFNIIPTYKNILNSQVSAQNNVQNSNKNTNTNQNVNANINKLSKNNKDNILTNKNDQSFLNVYENFDWWHLGAMLWALVTSILILFLVVSYIRIQIKLSKEHELHDNEINELVNKYKKQEGIKLNIKGYCDDSFDTPCVFGIFKPCIIFPKYMLNKIDNKQKNYMILHEIMHIKGKDNFINILSIIFQAIHWFNPILWYAFIQMRKDCEIACDERVVHRLDGEGCKEYALALISLADEQRKRSFYSVALAFGESNIKRRVKDIMKLKKQSIFAAILAVAVMVSTSVVVLTDAKNQYVNNTQKNVKTKISQTGSAKINTDYVLDDLWVITKGGPGAENQDITLHVARDKYNIDIPAQWGNSFKAVRTQYGVAFNFIGKSKMSRYYNDTAKKNQGLNMFYIGTKQQMDKFKFYDSAKKLGTINKVDYYYFTQPDYPIGALKTVVKDKKEQALMESDFKIAANMQKQVNSVLKTFGPSK